MEPVSVISLITVLIPFLTTAVKKLCRTDKLEETKRKGINALIPIVLGIISAGAYEYSRSGDWVNALAVGLGSGGAASSVRDLDKNLLSLGSAVRSLLTPKAEETPKS